MGNQYSENQSVDPDPIPQNYGLAKGGFDHTKPFLGQNAIHTGSSSKKSVLPSLAFSRSRYLMLAALGALCALIGALGIFVDYTFAPVLVLFGFLLAMFGLVGALAS